MKRSEAIGVREAKKLDTSWTGYRLVNHGDGDWGLTARHPETGERYTYCEAMGIFAYDPEEG